MMAISWIGIVILVFVLVMVVKGVANPGTRPFIIGLAGVIGAALVVLFFSRSVAVHQSNMPVQAPQMGHATVASPPAVPHSYGKLTAEARAPSGVQSGMVRIGYQLFDQQARDCSIDVQYSPDRGKTWFPATEGTGGTGISGLTSSMWGTQHDFLWDTLSDLGAVRNSNVEVRVAPVSSVGAGTSGTSTFFVVDNRRLASRASKSTTPLPSAAPQKADLVAALGDAVFQAWTRSGSASRTMVASKTSKLASPHALPLSQREKGGLSPPARREDVSTQPPAWVKATPQQQGDVYLMTVHVGPYTTLLECQRELPKALQAAVAEYAELLLGDPHVHLADDILQLSLERQRWVESRPIDIAGAAQSMVVLHVQIGFDPAMQRQIRFMAEHATQHVLIMRRLAGAGVALGGVLGLLALAWGGLSMIIRRQETSRDTTSAEELAPAAATKSHRFSVLLVVGVIVAIAFLAALFVPPGMAIPH